MTRLRWDKARRADAARRQASDLPVLGSREPVQERTSPSPHTRPSARDWREERDNPTWLRKAART